MFIFRLILSIVPLALTPLLGFFIAEGYLNFGGAEKDLFLLIPWMVWSLVYFVLFLILWRRKFSITKGCDYAAVGATGALALIYGVILIWPGGILG
ncbi:MAG: hypothetical protein ACE1Z2_04255 [Acidobacteriota bacterium]